LFIDTNVSARPRELRRVSERAERHGRDAADALAYEPAHLAQVEHKREAVDERLGCKRCAIVGLCGNLPAAAREHDSDHAVASHANERLTDHPETPARDEQRGTSLAVMTLSHS
jgi:hypothetical protein